MGDPFNPVRQALHEVIVNLLSPDLASRQLAEQQILALQVTDGETSRSMSLFNTLVIALHLSHYLSARATRFC